MKIKFVEVAKGGRDFKKGDEVEFVGRIEEGYARKYIDRGWAIDISPKVSEATVATTEADEAAATAQAEADRLQAEADKLAARHAIEIPDDWQDLPWFSMRSLAASLTDDPVKTKEDAAAAIQDEIDRRAA